jgi:hypothetical protein
VVRILAGEDLLVLFSEGGELLKDLAEIQPSVGQQEASGLGGDGVFYAGREDTR